ncbi:MAG: hypothetical protein ACRCZ0_08665 [Cetobacterium sp.]
MKNLRGFNVKYLGATNTNGCRIIIKDTFSGKKVTIPFDYECNNTIQVVEKFFNLKNIEIVGICENTNDYTILINDFSFDLKK